MRIDPAEIKKKRNRRHSTDGGWNHGGAMAGLLRPSVLGLQSSIRQKRSTGRERKGGGSHPIRKTQEGRSDDGSALGGSGGRRRRSSEKRLRLLGEEKQPLDEIGERGGVRALFKRGEAWGAR